MDGRTWWGGPTGVNLERYQFNDESVHDSWGKIFIFESCDTGCIWTTMDPLVLSLLSRGAHAVVGSVDMGGVGAVQESTSYYFTTPSVDVGTAVLINNAYFTTMKISGYPKAVLFGDPSVHTFSSEVFHIEETDNGYEIIDRTTTPQFEKILLLPSTGYSFLFPTNRGYTFATFAGSGEFKRGIVPTITYLFPHFRRFFSPVDILDSVVTRIFPLFILFAAFMGFFYRDRIRTVEKRQAMVFVLSSFSTLLCLILVDKATDTIVLARLFLIFLSILAIIYCFDTYKKKIFISTLFFFLPSVSILIFAFLMDFITFHYSLFMLLLLFFVSLFASVLLIGIYQTMKTLIQRIVQRATR